MQRLLALLLILIATPALAQPTGTRIGRSASERDVALVLAKIGSCMARTRPVVVRRWLNLIPGSKAEEDFVATQEGVLSVCMEHGDSSVVTHGRLHYVASELRPHVALSAGALAARAAPEARSLAAGLKPWFSDGLAGLGKDATFDKRAIVQQDIGHCIIVANWAASRDFLRSTAGSKDEAAALASLKPAIGPCLPMGEQFRITKTILRNLLSEPFYHLATQPSSQAGASR